jgi:hypothetical protein
MAMSTLGVVDMGVVVMEGVAMKVVGVAERCGVLIA